jgi:hypothetical protein
MKTDLIKVLKALAYGLAFAIAAGLAPSFRSKFIVSAIAFAWVFVAVWKIWDYAREN